MTLTVPKMPELLTSMYEITARPPPKLIPVM